MECFIGILAIVLVAQICNLMRVKCMSVVWVIAAMAPILCSIQSIASQFAAQIQHPFYAITTAEGFNMDCLKAINTSDNQVIGVFHSSIQQKASGYNALYLASMQTSQYSSNWTMLSMLSQRGSQGYIYQLPTTRSFLVLYELQNHEHGNTIAIRYYESLQRLKAGNFLYEYQIEQKVDRVNVRNIGTPSVEDLVVTKQETNPHFNNFNLTIKFHYSPDGQRDVPGYGFVNLAPLRDFVDTKGQWIGGCKQRYSGWLGNTDSQLQLAIRRVHSYSKIGQRDLFVLTDNSVSKKYYLYEVNINPVFNWKDWRIMLYSQSDNRAVQIPFSLGGDEDLANPHISLMSYDASNNAYNFLLTFFLPSEGVTPGSEIRAGEMTAFVTIRP